MSTKPKLLYLSSGQTGHEPELSSLAERFEIVSMRNPVRALLKLSREAFAGVFVSGEHLKEVLSVGRLLQNERILQGMPDGVALIDGDNTIVWANARLRQFAQRDTLSGSDFYGALGNPEIIGPDFSPFNSALGNGRPSSTMLRASANRYFRIHAAPVMEVDGPPRNLIVTVHDISVEVLQQQKLEAIHKAGEELSSLTAEDLTRMTVEERIELLKSNILHFTQDLLKFDVVEIRLIDQKTGQLEPLLAVGMKPEAVNRVLRPGLTDNGVTGFVAATAKSYLCEDTTQDPLFLEGCCGAKSSLTVPLTSHEEVIGTFNVESPKPCAFTESDRQFLEIFSHHVAQAINTLELLNVQKAATCVANVEAIHSAVALPIDEILNDAVNIMERYIGHEPEVVERLQRILRNARDIKQVIHEVGHQMAPSEALPQVLQGVDQPGLRGLRVLVVDADEPVRVAAHNLLERYGCVVETAHDGAECLSMVRNLGEGAAYDVIIADVRLPDLSGYELFCKLQGLLDAVPMALMTGFGYDPGHSIVKARQAGVKHVLYKPFRLDQLLAAVEQVAQEPTPKPAAAS